MSFSLPTRSRPIDELLSAIELWFDDRYQTDDENWPSGRFLVRGGVCWPEHYDQRSDSVRGCAILACYNLAHDVAYVFEEMPFVCIDHIVDPATRELTFTGLAPWFNTVWAKYHADTYYVWQPDPVRDRWEREVRHSPALSQMAPRFVACPEWGDVTRGENLIWEWLTRKKLRYFAGEPIDATIKAYRKDEEKRFPPAMHALACCLSGMSTMVEQAREVARSPQTKIKLENRLMIDNPRDWRGN